MGLNGSLMGNTTRHDTTRQVNTTKWVGSGLGPKKGQHDKTRHEHDTRHELPPLISAKLVIRNLFLREVTF